MSNLYEDEFGFIPEPALISLPCGKIEPLPEYHQLKEDLERAAHRDGFLYPPTITVRRAILGSCALPVADLDKWELVPRSERPSPVQDIPASHKLSVRGDIGKDGRNGVGGFLVHLTGLVYGVRAQFHDWLIDGRVSIKNRNDFCVHGHAADRLFEAALNTWSAWPEQLQTRITNILFVVAKASCEEYEWLKFALDYMAFDACYRIAEHIHHIQAKTHKDRFAVMASYFEVHHDSRQFSCWTQMRNNLFHEALWNTEAPGHSTFSSDSENVMYLGAFTSRITVALLGFPCKYVGSDWKIVSPILLE